jgi:magnesium transporter
MGTLDVAEKATILVVDDTPDNLILMSNLLKGDYQVKIAAGGEKALEIAVSGTPPDLVLLDIMMPGMDGYEVCQQLKDNPRTMNIPVIFLTARAEKEDERKGLELGAVDYITKPISPAIVMARVKNHLALKTMASRLREQNQNLAHKVQEVEASHEQIRRQSEEVKRLYDKIVAEQKRSVELSLQPGVMVGVEKEERLATHWYRSLRLRHPWLQINLLTAFVAGAVVGVFQGTIDRLLILTMFLPVLAGQAGNTGSQALAITLRGLTLGDLKSGKEKSLVRKEALLGLLNGSLVGLVAAMGMYVVASAQHLPSALMLSVVVFLAMIGSCVISGISGAIVPLVLKRLGADPATASSIFLTTATDVASMGMLLGLATLLVK